MLVQPGKEAYETLVNEVKALKEEVKRLRNVRTTSEVELKGRKTVKRATDRNSWANIYNENTTLRKNTRFTGTGSGNRLRIGVARQMVYTVGRYFLVSLRWYVFLHLLRADHVGGASRNITVVFGSCTIISFGLLYYKNISYIIVKRLLRELNVVIIVILSILNYIIEIFST